MNVIQPEAFRILIIDDNPSIHDDFKKILVARSGPTDLSRAKAALFGDAEEKNLRSTFTLDFARQGEEGFHKVEQALASNQPYALAFVDVRMPPGWDGIETIERIRAVDPHLQIVITTAYSDYSWENIIERTSRSDSLVILKKPFETIEVLQLAHTLTTKWRLAEDVRGKLRDLDQLVAKRTNELEGANSKLRLEINERAKLEQQLLHAQKMEAVGQLAAGVAHDFNNLLTIIQGHANLRLTGDANEDAIKSSFITIRDAAERGASLTRQLLAFSRKQVIQQKTIKLNTVLQKVGDMLAQFIGSHIRINMTLGENLPCIYADPCSLEQVIMNLALNSRDALPGEGGELAITTALAYVGQAELAHHPEGTPGKYVRLTISDNGCGMDAATKRRIFEPFFTTKETGKGTGMGLAIVYGIVKQHSGWIDVTSQVGRGTAFDIYLPVQEGKEESMSVRTEGGKSDKGHHTILVAEDEPALRELIVAVLESYNYRVLVAANGVEALDLWKKNTHGVDLLFTDIVMPEGISGWQLAERLRAQNPDLRIVLTSGYNKELEAGDRKLPSNWTFLPKPYRPGELLSILQKSLSSEGGDGSSLVAGSLASLN